MSNTAVASIIEDWSCCSIRVGISSLRKDEAQVEQVQLSIWVWFGSMGVTVCSWHFGHFVMRLKSGAVQRSHLQRKDFVSRSFRRRRLVVQQALRKLSELRVSVQAGRAAAGIPYVVSYNVVRCYYVPGFDGLQRIMRHLLLRDHQN